jgi:hypothetical protein
MLIAEKCYEEEQNKTESYSLLSGITIKEINSIENRLLNLLEYRLLPRNAEVDLILRGDVDGLFLERDCSH